MAFMVATSSDPVTIRRLLSPPSINLEEIKSAQFLCERYLPIYRNRGPIAQLHRLSALIGLPQIASLLWASHAVALLVPPSKTIEYFFFEYTKSPSHAISTLSPLISFMPHTFGLPPTLRKFARFCPPHPRPHSHFFTRVKFYPRLNWT